MRNLVVIILLSIYSFAFGMSIKEEHAKQMKESEEYLGSGVVLLSGVHTFFRCHYANTRYHLIQELAKSNKFGGVLTAKYFGDILGIHDNGNIYRFGYSMIYEGLIGEVSPRFEFKYTKISNGYRWKNGSFISELDIFDNVYLLFEKNTKNSFTSVSGCVRLRPVNDVYKLSIQELKNNRGKMLEFTTSSSFDFPKEYFKD